MEASSNELFLDLTLPTCMEVFSKNADKGRTDNSLGSDLNPESYKHEAGILIAIL